MKYASFYFINNSGIYILPNLKRQTHEKMHILKSIKILTTNLI